MELLQVWQLCSWHYEQWLSWIEKLYSRMAKIVFGCQFFECCDECGFYRLGKKRKCGVWQVSFHEAAFLQLISQARLKASSLYHASVKLLQYNTHVTYFSITRDSGKSVNDLHLVQV